MAAPWSAVAKLRVIGEMHGSQTVNVMHFATNTIINDEAGRNALLEQLAQAMLLCLIDFLLPAVTSDWRLLRVDVVDISSNNLNEVSIQPNAVSVGALSPASASFIATLLNLKTGGGGKSGRGKQFLPPPGEGESTASSLDPGTVTLVLAYIQCVVQKFVGADASEDWRIGVLSQKILKQPGGSLDSAFREVTSITVNSVLAKMGSRKKGVGA